MRYHSKSLTLTLPRSAWFQRGLFVALALASLTLVYAERQDKNWVQQLRLGLLSATAPVAQAVASPARALEDLAAGWHQVWQVHSENRQLRFDNAQLMQWREAALQLEAENASLRKLMQYQPAKAAHFISAKSVGAASSSLSHRLQIDAGLGDGLRRHLPVINAHGMIGRVLHLSPEHSEVLLITDISSRIPVTLQPSGERAILIGDHNKLPYLKLANDKARPALGEVVLSADDGGLLPSGLRIGSLFAARDGRYEVRPAFHGERIDYVRILTPQH